MSLRQNVRFVISKSQFNYKVNFDLPGVRYWTKIFSNLLHLISSNCPVCEYSCEFNEALTLGPVYPNLYFRYIILILKY